MLTRRRFLAGAAGLAGVSVLPHTSVDALEPRLPDPDASGIDHVIVVMMENRSFDHFLGWVPGANGRQQATFLDEAGVPHDTYHLTDFQGCGHPDPDHSFAGGREQYNRGRCDGFLLSGNDEFAIGYYLAADQAFYGAAVPGWTVCDRYFAAIMAPTFPNRFYQHAAQTDRITNTFDPVTLPTIWDRLAEAGLDGRYYYSDAPFILLWGAKYLGITRTFSSFLADCASGDLPEVAFVDPRFLGEGEGTSGDDHPFADIRVGQAFLNQIYEAVSSGPAWANTVLVINYDEWGGFFDHVRPAVAPDAHPEWGLRGFRVPCLVISPFARRGFVDHNTYDHTSVLKMIEWRWDLAPLSPRDAAARNLAMALDLRHPSLDAPQYDVPPAVGLPCPSSAFAGEAQWLELRDVARDYGWSG